MTFRDFCFWIQGFFELLDAAPAGRADLTPQQVQVIRQHLTLVFTHVTGQPAVAVEPEKCLSGSPVPQTPEAKSVEAMIKSFESAIGSVGRDIGGGVAFC